MSSTLPPVAGRPLDSGRGIDGPGIDGPAIDSMGRTDDGVLDSVTTAFGLSAAVTVVFNTLLAWVKDAYDPLNSLMAHLSGHHWTTHGLADVVLFFGLGFILMQRHIQMAGERLAGILAAAVIVGGGGLALWFLLV